MDILIEPDAAALGRRAALVAVETLHKALADRGKANLILATGASQFELLKNLVTADLDWNRVTCFHLDEYIGLSATHPASFRKYLQERFVDKIDGPKQFHWVCGDAHDAEAECNRVGEILHTHPIDVACIGIGENGHLAFNDPPADFETDEPYLLVDLDDACRQQQFGEGWFPTFDDVPKVAISMSIRQIMKSATIVCTVPDERKARAVQAAVEGPIGPEVPASILREHPQATLLLDQAAASLLRNS